MTNLDLIRRPIEAELQHYEKLLCAALSHEDPLLGAALSVIRSRRGKLMRPMLVLLVAKNYAPINEKAYHSALSLELLHNASLVHDDVVDESSKRRGNSSINSLFDNKAAVLVGDYILSLTLFEAARIGDLNSVKTISQLGATLSEGEILQLPNEYKPQPTEENYYRIIRKKTASLFEACAALGARSANASEKDIELAARFGDFVGICFQIRDDIFDYFSDANIGKPTGNDMREGKLTLPALYALQQTCDPKVHEWAKAVRQNKADEQTIEALIEFTKNKGGIDYAQKEMLSWKKKAEECLSGFTNTEIREALTMYVDFVVGRDL